MKFSRDMLFTLAATGPTGNLLTFNSRAYVPRAHSQTVNARENGKLTVARQAGLYNPEIKGVLYPEEEEEEDHGAKGWRWRWRW